ncbi:hypothetical protein [Gloeobacter morelensis]|uniref:Uncharacterized protein n=1 Tax=Gloeobacter morelensis MG652769 TaxID=2781736 RepID=A0ABY3PLM0_9CYAN|nr:hypothetical protein [Gloeobacter morelensis]UFP94591.1 hypothetical protein ISF26_23140 [Gloeobacter morelensis MG652769]
MKDLLLCERTIGELKLRGYLLQEHHLIAVWGLPQSPERPRRLICHNFEHLNDLWRTWQQMEPEALKAELLGLPEGVLPKPKPKIFKKAGADEQGGGLLKKPFRPRSQDAPSSGPPRLERAPRPRRPL